MIHHAEVLDKDGNFYTGNFRSARNENIYILSGGNDVFKPSYTFQGFRYIKLSEYPFETVDPDAFRAIVVHSDIKRTGDFICGNEKKTSFITLQNKSKSYELLFIRLLMFHQKTA